MSELPIRKPSLIDEHDPSRARAAEYQLVLVGFGNCGKLEDIRRRSPMRMWEACTQRRRNRVPCVGGRTRQHPLGQEEKVGEVDEGAVQ